MKEAGDERMKESGDDMKLRYFARSADAALITG